MLIAMQTVELRHEPGLFAHIEREVRTALAPLEGRVDALHVQVRELHGTSHCTVALSVPGTRGVVFDAIHPDVRTAVSRVGASLAAWSRSHAARVIDAA